LRQRAGLFKVIAPGLLAGISNVDACAILCLLSIGAVYRYSLLWALTLGLLLYTFTLQVASEVALVTGKGLAENIRERFGGGASSITVLTSMAANISLISAEIAGAAVAITALTEAPLQLSAAIAALILLVIACTKTVDLVDEVLIVLSMTLVAYLVLVFTVGVDYTGLLSGLIKPGLQLDAEYWVAVLAIIGMAIGPNVLLYEASDLVEKGVGEKALPHAMVSSFIGSMVSLVICVAIVVCGGYLGKASETMIEAVDAFRAVFGQASTPLFSLGLFAGSMLAAVITLHSTIALLSETYGWAKVGGRATWPTWATIITLASLTPTLLVAKPVKVAIVSSVLSSIATIPPFVFLAKLFCDSNLMRGLEARGYIKAVTWIIVAVFVSINVGGLLVAVLEKPVLGYINVPADLLVLLLGASLAPYMIKGLRGLFNRRGLIEA